jgi:hypothetical protein
MSLLGTGGELELSREAPPLTVITDARFDSAKLWLTEPGYWPGDRVLLSCPRGLPVDVAGNGYADCPDGHRHWGGQGVTGPATTHRTTDAGPYWAVSNASAYWDSSAATGLTTQLSCYVGRDTLGRLSFYDTEINAVNGGATGKYLLTGVAFGALVISAYSADATFQAALATLAQTVQALLPLDKPEQPVEKVTTIPDSLASPDLIGWEIQASLAEWTLDQEGGTQDTTALSESYGDSVKALVRGSGTLQFNVDRTYRSGYQDATALLRLVMMLDRGCRTRARFFLCRSQNSDPVLASPMREPKLAGALWYEADLLLARTGVQTAASEIITGSAAFLVLGETQLKMGA